MTEKNIEISEEENVDKAPSINNAVQEMEISHRPVYQHPSAMAENVVAVYCTATLENCPDSQLNEDYSQSIRRFLLSEQHLERNIQSTELQYLSSRSFRGNLYTHLVSVILYVKTVTLWESPASYVRKHLEANYWERSNGTKIRLSRIHQK